jgi:glycolate oxidase iron-sulfur subunit
VHCGFCNATCPTYQLLGDELDGPRGRIYLIKQVLEGGDVTRSTQQHLDRCLTCLNCQTTCPSGVEYGHLVDIGRRIVDARVQRPAAEQTIRWVLKEGLTSRLFAPAMRLGQALRPLLPAAFRKYIPPRAAHTPAGPSSVSAHRRQVLMLQGCVQPSMMPNIDAAAVGCSLRRESRVVQSGVAGCCGALRTHLGDHEGPREHAPQYRRLDAHHRGGRGGGDRRIGYCLQSRTQGIWTRALRRPALCREGGAHQRAGAGPERISAGHRARLEEQTAGRWAEAPGLALALHVATRPATARRNRSASAGVGFEVAVANSESHFCCGSAGVYSLLQPDLALRLRDRKLGHLAALDPQIIVSANLGCIQHLASGTSTPVKHWVEVLDGSLA